MNGDGLVDFVVLSEYDANHIFLGTSTGFRNIDWATATGDKERYPSTSCSIGDVDGDGHLDLFIANAVPKASAYACLAVPFNLNPPNQLFINRGRSKTRVSFKDVSFTSGINNYGGTIPKGKYTLSWAGAFVDVNLDGHLDIVVADDQCGLQTLVEDPVNGGTRGGLRIQLGDGKGNFTSNTLIPVDAKGNNRYPGGGNWMGLGFGDFNCDGKLDFFASNAGDYHGARFDLMAGRGLPNKIGRLSSRWWLGTSSANFVDASIKELGATGMYLFYSLFSLIGKDHLFLF